MYIFDLVTGTVFVLSGEEYRYYCGTAILSLKYISQIVWTNQALKPPTDLY